MKNVAQPYDNDVGDDVASRRARAIADDKATFARLAAETGPCTRITRSSSERVAAASAQRARRPMWRRERDLPRIDDPATMARLCLERHDTALRYETAHRAAGNVERAAVFTRARADALRNLMAVRHHATRRANRTRARRPDRRGVCVRRARRPRAQRTCSAASGNSGDGDGPPRRPHATGGAS